MRTMEAIHRSPAMTEIKISAPHGFTSTERSANMMTENTSIVDTTKSTAQKKKRNAGERIQRSRERNRIHARKTRQRKKEQLQLLQSKAEQLKGEQINLKLMINEKNTANILCCLFSNNQASQSTSSEDPKVEALLTRPEDEIPDPSKLPALQPLILPSGAQHSKRGNNNIQLQKLPNDGIDYELLGKDRSKCTPAELDQIRRERNRMHAKRTRDRKRLFMEEMAEMCKVLEGENMILQKHLAELNGVKSKTSEGPSPGPTQTQPSNSAVVTVSPSLSPTTAPVGVLPESRQDQPSSQTGLNKVESILPLTSRNGESFDQMKTLLDAAGVFDLDTSMNKECNKNTSTSVSCVVSVSSEDHTDHSSRPLKKRCQFHVSSNTSSDDDCAQ